MRKGPNSEPLSGGWEYDRLTRAKRYHKFGPGVGRYIKNGFWRRMRRLEKLRTKDELDDLWLYDPRGMNL